MKIKGVLAFILIVFLLIIIFVGVPYFLTNLKSINFHFTSTSTPLFFRLPFYTYTYNSPTSVAPLTSITQSTNGSVYRGQVRIYGVSRSDPEQISLSSAFVGNGSIDITGWKIVSSQRRIETPIGRGLALPQFNSFLSDIRLKSGDSARITATASPLISSFQVNNCFGWLNSIYNFSSSFNYCYPIQLRDLTGIGLDSACQDLILSSGSCRAPSDNILNIYSSECKIWVERNLNYSACVENHMSDLNFYKGWQIYTGNGNLMFDRLHDRIELRDQAGLLVDSYEY